MYYEIIIYIKCVHCMYYLCSIHNTYRICSWLLFFHPRVISFESLSISVFKVHTARLNFQNDIILIFLYIHCTNCNYYCYCVHVSIRFYMRVTMCYWLLLLVNDRSNINILNIKLLFKRYLYKFLRQKQRKRHDSLRKMFQAIKNKSWKVIRKYVK